MCTFCTGLLEGKYFTQSISSTQKVNDTCFSEGGEGQQGALSPHSRWLNSGTAWPLCLDFTVGSSLPTGETALRTEQPLALPLSHAAPAGRDAEGLSAPGKHMDASQRAPQNNNIYISKLYVFIYKNYVRLYINCVFIYLFQSSVLAAGSRTLAGYTHSGTVCSVCAPGTGFNCCQGCARVTQHRSHASTCAVQLTHPFYTHCRAVGSAGEVLC